MIEISNYITVNVFTKILQSTESTRKVDNIRNLKLDLNLVIILIYLEGVSNKNYENGKIDLSFVLNKIHKLRA